MTAEPKRSIVAETSTSTPPPADAAVDPGACRDRFVAVTASAGYRCSLGLLLRGGDQQVLARVERRPGRAAPPA